MATDSLWTDDLNLGSYLKPVGLFMAAWSSGVGSKLASCPGDDIIFVSD